ncbi:hypothetical protein [uncultured Alistipes sp.]|uniref:hypothetical protein n=1 Tax=uncultured Alistipes sp. TaxID=538949 RepID=UPI0026392117|nr:hypothetical protein [uncultured Alistipes sp.]
MKITSALALLAAGPATSADKRRQTEQPMISRIIGNSHICSFFRHKRPNIRHPRREMAEIHYLYGWISKKAGSASPNFKRPPP